MRDKGVKVFYENLSWIWEIKSLTAVKVLDFLIFKTKRNSAEIVLNKGDKARFAESLSVSPVTISKAFSVLDEYGIVRKDGDTYILNPNMYWYGDLPARNKAVVHYKYLFPCLYLAVQDPLRYFCRK